MRSEYLEYFLEVVKTGSFNKAGLNLNVTHQTISTAITNLENECNTQLMIRNTKGIQLTETGKVMEKYARSILDITQQCKTTIAQIEKTSNQTDISGHLTILASPLINHFVIPSFTESIFMKYPKVTLQVLEVDSEEILLSLQTGKGDLGFFAITSTIAHDDSLYNQCQIIDSNIFRLCAVTTPGHPLGGYKSISIKTLRQYPLAIYQVADTPNTLHANLSQYGDIQIHLATSNYTVYTQCILAGQVVGILPKIRNKNTLLTKDFEAFSWIPIKELSSIPLGYATAPNLSENKEKLCQLFTEEIKHLL